MDTLRNAASAAGEQGFANYIEIDRLLLASWRAHVAGESQLALDLAREAVQLEGRTQNIRSHRELCGQPRRRLVICCLTLGVPARHSRPTKAHWLRGRPDSTACWVLLVQPGQRTLMSRHGNSIGSCWKSPRQAVPAGPPLRRPASFCATE